MRLVLYKDKVNKSRRKGDVPLFQFYINMPLEDKLIYMCWKSNKVMVELKPEEKTVVYEGNEPKDSMPLDQYMVHSY